MRRYKPKPAGPFRYFNSSPEATRQLMLMHVGFPLNLRNVEDLLFERGIVLCQETIRFWWKRFGPMFAAGIRRQRGARRAGFAARGGTSTRCQTDSTPARVAPAASVLLHHDRLIANPSA